MDLRCRRICLFCGIAFVYGVDPQISLFILSKVLSKSYKIHRKPRLNNSSFQCRSLLAKGSETRYDNTVLLHPAMSNISRLFS